MSYLFIISAIIFLLAAILILGGTGMAIRYKKEVFRFCWSLLMIISALVLLTETVIAVHNPENFLHPSTIPFTVRILIEWHCIALMVAILCVIGLRSKLTRFEALFFPAMLLVCVVTAICYHIFIGTYTPLYSWHDIIANINEKDVMMKVILFGISVIDTAYLLFVPIIEKLSSKDVKFTGWFKFYLFFSVAQPVSFVLYVIGFPFAGIALVIGCLVFLVSFSWAIARNRNPMVVKLKSYTKEEEALAASLDKLNEKMKINKYYLDKSLNIDVLTDKTGLTIDEIIVNYTAKGYESFMDYVNSFRYAYYNNLVKQYPCIPQHILISDSGFPSQTDFEQYVKAQEAKSSSNYGGIMRSISALFM